MNESPTHLDIFSGIGGFALAARWAGFRTVGFCEIDVYCRKVLAKNFLADAPSSQNNGERRDSEQCWATVGRNGKAAQRDNGQADHDSVNGCRPIIHSNIFDFDGTFYRGVSLITGGFPCQPFSVAGKRGGAADDRAIWPEMFRVINEARPAWILGENVPGIIPMELDNVLSDLEGISYATRSFVIPACGVDARHRRDRVWIIGRNVADNGEWTPWLGRRIGEYSETSGNGGAGARQANGEWFPEPDVGRVAHGIPSRVDRLKGLGNAIVPQVAYEILREIRNQLSE